MTSNNELIQYCKDITIKLSEISIFHDYISYSECLNFVQNARRYKRDAKNNYCHNTEVLNEITGKLERLNITHKRTLKEFLLILIATENHFLTKQQIDKLLTK